MIPPVYPYEINCRFVCKFPYFLSFCFDIEVHYINIIAAKRIEISIGIDGRTGEGGRERNGKILNQKGRGREREVVIGKYFI